MSLPYPVKPFHPSDNFPRYLLFVRKDINQSTYMWKNLHGKLIAILDRNFGFSDNPHTRRSAGNDQSSRWQRRSLREEANEFR